MSWQKSIWDKIQVYSPIFLLAIVAMATYLMAHGGSSHKELPNTTPTLPASVPDYVIQTLSYQGFNANGQLITQVMGEVAQHYEQSQELRIEQMHLINDNPQMALVTATANEGRLKDDQTVVQLIGDAHVIRQPQGMQLAKSPTQFLGNQLTYYPKTQQVTSNEPVRIQDNTNDVTGNQLQYSEQNEQLSMQGRIRVLIQPAKNQQKFLGLPKA